MVGMGNSKKNPKGSKPRRQSPKPISQQKDGQAGQPNLTQPSQQVSPVDKTAKDAQHWYQRLGWEFVLASFLALFPFGWSMLGLPQSQILGVACWVLCAILLIHLFYFKTGWRKSFRIAASVVVTFCCIGLAVFALAQPQRLPATK